MGQVALDYYDWFEEYGRQALDDFIVHNKRAGEIIVMVYERASQNQLDRFLDEHCFGPAYQDYREDLVR